MDKRTLLKQTKSQLINLLLKHNIEIKKLLKQNVEIKKLLQKNMKPQPKNEDIVLPPSELKDDYKPVPLPRKSVKQMVQEYEDNIILPPLEFRDDYKPVPLPRTKNQSQHQGLR